MNAGFIIRSVIVFLLLNALYVPKISAYTNGMEASIVLGQADFTGGTANRGGTPSEKSLTEAISIVTDGTHLAIADTGNNRVLLYNSIPDSIDAPADIVVGQADFSSVSANRGGSVAANTLSTPRGVAFAGTKLIVSDWNNDRVLIYDPIPTTNGEDADVVIGQSSMTGSDFGTSDTELASPWGVSYDTASGKLVVTDWANIRVLIYNSVPTSNGVAANVVVGQAAFNTSDVGTSATQYFLPTQARIFNNKLFVVDTDNNRILIYNSVPISNGAAADVVIGQTSMTDDDYGSTASLVFSPEDMFYDGSRLFIADDGNDRILGFNSIPVANGASADFVLGHATLTEEGNPGGTSATASLLFHPYSVTGTSSKLIVGDTGYHRVLIYKDTSNTTTTAQLSASSTSSAPDPLFPSGYIYRITTGPTVPEAPSLAIVSPSTGDTSIKAMVTKDASPHDVAVSIEKKDPSALLAETQVFPWQQGLNTAGEIYKFEVKSAFNGYPIPEFEKPVTVILSYDPERVKQINPNKLRIAYFDESTKRWKVMKNNTVLIPETHSIANVTTKFSYFAVVYPR